MSTTRQFFNQEIMLAGNPEWFNWIVSVLITMFIVGGIWLSIKIINQVNRDLFISGVYQNLYYLIPLTYGSIFLFTIILWRWFY